MEIQVRPLTSFEGSSWEVHMDSNKVTFRSESEARAFVQTLESRLSAPHQLLDVAADHTLSRRAG
ncbi:hypothetical protein [Stutzerimonas xanthomarina]|uniref:Uncharacterized protein n=2 Tax=Stutzerimonas xanthomarina TaxID=271420 RepID=A0A1M5ME94_9GAMM|nr:hypothetical protein [Stutzerimonas xanthomarina]MCP9338953.1 hypothetical protein [Stutzerimonas xanthomarina]SEH90407.1 hypothetical protein SAMN05216535_2570 [Stutzerimonas xanthomarina]SHG75630.1 hypothetical protein SAMN02744645_1247 [Stutzerimonas xanthomarina DSM 18231]